MRAFRLQWKRAAAGAAFLIVLFGSLLSWSPAHAGPTLQQTAVSSDVWLGITTDTDTVVANPRHRGPALVANAPSVERLRIDTAPLLASARPMPHPIRLVVHRKLPPASDDGSDAH